MTILAIPCSAPVIPSQSIYFLRVNECMRVISTKKSRGWFHHPLDFLLSIRENRNLTQCVSIVLVQSPQIFRGSLPWKISMAWLINIASLPDFLLLKKHHELKPRKFAEFARFAVNFL